jgi:hypothetical protein
MLPGHPGACIYYDPAVACVKCSADWGVLVFFIIITHYIQYRPGYLVAYWRNKGTIPAYNPSGSRF